MLGHISKFDGNNSLIKHGVVQGNNIMILIYYVILMGCQG